MRRIRHKAAGACLMLLTLSFAHPGNADATPPEKAFVQIDDVVATTDAASQRRIWLRVATPPAGLNAACAIGDGSLLVAENQNAPWLDAVETLAKSAKSAHFKILVEYAVDSSSARLDGIGATPCKVSRLSLGD